MNRAELAAEVAARTGLPKQDVNRAVDAVFGAILDSLRRSEEVKVPGFGSFVVADRAARTGRHPQTGAPMEIKASRQARFKAGRGVQDALNI